MRAVNGRARGPGAPEETPLLPPTQRGSCGSQHALGRSRSEMLIMLLPPFLADRTKLGRQQRLDFDVGGPSSAVTGHSAIYGVDTDDTATVGWGNPGRCVSDAGRHLSGNGVSRQPTSHRPWRYVSLIELAAYLPAVFDPLQPNRHAVGTINIQMKRRQQGASQCNRPHLYGWRCAT